jgi:hypothetical protein
MLGIDGNEMVGGMAVSAVAARRLPLPHHLLLLPYPGRSSGASAVSGKKTI